MAVRTSRILLRPTLDAGSAEEGVVAGVAFDGASGLGHYLVADAAEDVILDVLDVLSEDHALLSHDVCSFHSSFLINVIKQA